MSKPSNITDKHREAFDALTSGEYSNFALFSCYVNGKPASAIVAVNKQEDNSVRIEPIFVTVTDDMVLTDEDGEIPCPRT